MFIIALPPALNFFASLMYLFTVEFYSRELFDVCVVSVFIPNLYFLLILYQMSAPPYTQGLYPGYQYISAKIWWLRFEQGMPARVLPRTRDTEVDEDGEVKYETKRYDLFEANDSLFKLLFYCMYVMYWIGIQIFTLFLYAAFLVFTFPMTVFWLACGCFFYQSKLIAMRGIWNMWFRTWTNDEKHDIRSKIDSAILNEAFLIEFLFLSIPQIFLQSFNNFTVKDSWHIYSIAAYIIALTSFINGVSRYGYFIFVKGYDVAEVPLEVNVFNTKYVLDNEVHHLEHRKKLFKFEPDEDQKLILQKFREVKKVKKQFQKNIDDMKAMKKEDAKKQDVAWNLIVNHSKDNILIQQLSDAGINNQDDLEKASAGKLNSILSMITDNRYKQVVRDVFKLFPNFDDGSVSKNMFALAEDNTTAEESIKIEML